MTTERMGTIMTDRDKPRHTVHLTVDVHFEGDYYGPNELVGLCEEWIDRGFEDRSDLKNWTVDGHVVRESDSAP